MMFYGRKSIVLCASSPQVLDFKYSTIPPVIFLIAPPVFAPFLHCLVGCPDDDSANLDDSRPEPSTSTFASRNPYVGPGVATGVVTLANLFAIVGVKTHNRDEKDLLHGKLLVLAWFFSIAEGIVVLLAVPDSKESLKIGIVFMFSSVAAASGFCLRKAGRFGWAAIANAVLEGAFAAVFLFFFVERSTEMVFLMGAIAGNQALVGFAVARYVDATADPDEEKCEILCQEICFLVSETIGDAIAPLATALIMSLFHPESPWRSGAVFTWWGISGFANVSLYFLMYFPPISRLGFGLKLWLAGSAFFNGTSGVMSFVLYDMTINEIDDPPMFDIVWSLVVGSFGVYAAYAALMVLCAVIGVVPNGVINRTPDSSSEEGSKQA